VNSEIDLHCHSTASDGKLPAAELVARAAERGVKTLAITDHDTAEGYRLGQAAAQELGVRLIPGIELSCIWGGVTIHIVGLNFDPESDVMRAAEQAQTEARSSRSQIIAERVGKRLKHDIDLAEVQAYAGGESIGRPHFAQYLIDKGLVPSMAVAFNKYLGAGKPGDVKASWPEMATVVQWIAAAGGIPVMAHAHLYNMTRTKLRACLTDFVDAGGRGLEVAYGQMDNNQRGQMAGLAREFELLGSCGSDFHGPNRFGLDLGVMPPFPADVTPVWQSWA
jgi:predicted metal-dependent phosphoesterase TrpH